MCHQKYDSAKDRSSFMWHFGGSMRDPIGFGCNRRSPIPGVATGTAFAIDDPLQGVGAMLRFLISPISSSRKASRSLSSTPSSITSPWACGFGRFGGSVEFALMSALGGEDAGFNLVLERIE